MAEEAKSNRKSDDQKPPSSGKQINPFSEQEKHGDDAQRQVPRAEREPETESADKRGAGKG